MSTPERRSKPSKRRNDMSRLGSASVNRDLGEASPKSISNPFFSGANREPPEPSSKSSLRPFPVNDDLGKRAPKPTSRGPLVDKVLEKKVHEWRREHMHHREDNGIEREQVQDTPVDLFRMVADTNVAQERRFTADDMDRANTEINLLRESLQAMRNGKTELSNEVNALQEALREEKKRDDHLTAANDELLAQKNSEFAPRNDKHDVEKAQLRQKNAILTYDINCLAAKNGRLEKTIEQLRESAILSLTEKDLVGLDLRVPSDNELVSDLFELDSSIRSWSDECVSRWPEKLREDFPRRVPFQDKQVWYTLVDSSAHCSPLVRALIWNVLGAWIFDTRTSAGPVTDNKTGRDMTFDLWTTKKDSRSFRGLERTFCSSKGLLLNFQAFKHWRQLTVSLLAKNTKANPSIDGERTKQNIDSIIADVKLYCEEVLGEFHFNPWREPDVMNLERIVQQAISYSLKLHLHPNLLQLPTMFALKETQKNEPPATQGEIKSSELAKTAGINATIRPGLYQEINLADSSELTRTTFSAIEEAQLITIPILIHPNGTTDGFRKRLNRFNSSHPVA